MHESPGLLCSPFATQGRSYKGRGQDIARRFIELSPDKRRLFLKALHGPLEPPPIPRRR